LKSLATLLSSEFEPGVRSRGRDYYYQDLVRVRSGSSWSLAATVRGSRQYVIDIQRNDDDLWVKCDCPYFSSAGPCKHLWAAILTADSNGYVRGYGNAGSLTLHFDVPQQPEIIPAPRALPASQPKPIARPSRRGEDWRLQLQTIGRANIGRAPDPWPSSRQLLFVLDEQGTLAGRALVIELLCRDPKKAGGWSKPKTFRLLRPQVANLPEGEDREIVALLSGASMYYGYYTGLSEAISNRYQLLNPLAQMLLPRIARTGRCLMRPAQPSPVWPALLWDDAGAWEFQVEVKEDGRHWMVRGLLRRGEQRMELSEPALLTTGGFVITRDRVAPLNDHGAFSWITHLRKTGIIQVPKEDAAELLVEILQSPELPPLDLPEELQIEHVEMSPRFQLRLDRGRSYGYAAQKLSGYLSFDYDGNLVQGEIGYRGVYSPQRRRLIHRDRQAEQVAEERLQSLGFRRIAPTFGETTPHWELPPAQLPRVARALIAEGWHVQAEGKTFRKPSSYSLSISSGVDWFDLDGGVDYGGAAATLPELLKALDRGENMVLLSDGSYGMLPEEWLGKFAALAGMGAAHGESVRFRNNQVGLLDALLAARPEIQVDEIFTRARDQLRRFDGIRPAEQPPGFEGELRGYQRDGFGWMHFLREFGFGGCLADDMGVGKTVQVLALLETRRQLRAAKKAASPGEKPPSGPSLVVMPRSLVFNWKQEAARFAPRLRVLDYTGITRSAGKIEDCDLVITTYGTVRRDAVRLQEVPFDYVILDEAQAIKNAGTESAKAARLLRGNYRLALSGTPVENHLGELWSLFEFLNPGMLGGASVFKLAGGALRNPEEATRKMLAQALRPFILRRTKDQVAKELPPRVEQTLYCEMEPPQRKLYNELRDHYRLSLLGRIERDGLAKSKMHVLEALLRLRQAACHPGLIDPKRADDPSAKLDMLLPQLSEVLEEGHKALVFSQFTSLLALVRQRLDRDGVVYEYLDGKTRDRQARVERFQNDPGCPLFLISLKAGGLGLNLTSADYVFLLDPWWNPAVEAQAIDRAHRIGQSRHVFAYRLIARDTVEEKVLELQRTKRDLADAIINADNSLIRGLAREDLELLLS